MSGRTIHVVGVSGGKDSGVVGALAKARQDRTGMAVEYINSDTGNEAPWHRDHLEAYGRALGITIRFITQNFDAAIARRRERLPVQWAENGVPQHLIDHALELLVPTGVPYLDLVLSKGMFAAGARRKFCTEELKIRPAEEQIVKPILNAGNNVVQWYGIRADESAKRADEERHPRFGRVRTDKVPGWGWTIEYRPILNWTVEMIVAAHKHFGIPMNPAYGAGFSRYGCFPCINERKAGMAIIARRYPKEVERIAEWERRVTACNVSWKKPENFARRDPATFFPAGVVPRMERNDIHDVASWSLHARGNRQADFLAGFIPDQQFYSCTGGTGWCEAA